MVRRVHAMRVMKPGIVAATVLLGAVLSSPSAAVGQATLSPGCHALNDPALDGTYRIQEIGPLEFFAGETVTVVAAASPDPEDDVRFQVLSDTGAIIETQGGPVPQTFSYTVPADAMLAMRWLVLGPLSASWIVSCTGATYPLAVSPPSPAMNAVATPSLPVTENSRGLPLATSAVVAGAVLLHVAVAVLVRRRQAAGAW